MGGKAMPGTSLLSPLRPVRAGIVDAASTRDRVVRQEKRKQFRCLDDPPSDSLKQ